jgi:hypothetical protein
VCKERDVLSARLAQAERAVKISAGADAGDDNAEHRLLCAFVLDAESFFEDADVDESGDLSLDEFAAACSKKLPDVSQEVVQSLFDFFDTDRDSKISLEELSETIKIVVHFVQEARCEVTIVAVLLKMLLDRRPSAETAEEHSAERTEMLLSKLAEEHLVTALALKLPKRLVAHGAEEDKRRLEREACKKEQESNKDKFTSLPTAAYGDVTAFFQGLEQLGLPHSDILLHMWMELTQSADSKKTFVAWNSGRNETTSLKVCI